MAYRTGRRSSGRASTGYSRGRTSGFKRSSAYSVRRAPARRTVKRAASQRQQIVRLVIEQAPASGISRTTERLLGKMNPAPGRAKL